MVASHYLDLKTFYVADSEPMTRAFLDAYILEVLRNLPVAASQSLRAFGEIAVTCSRKGKTLNGYGDWFMGYGKEGDSLLKNIALVGEVKDRSVDISSDQALCQTYAYMLIIHQTRKSEKKQHPRVFGFLTNRRRWLFLMVTDSGELLKSKEFQEASEQKSILANLRYIFLQAQLSSPSTSPHTSTESLAPHWEHESLTFGDMEITCDQNTMGQGFMGESEQEEEEEEEGEEEEGSDSEEEST